MERLERRIQATICSSLDAMAHKVNDLGVRVMAVEERVNSWEEDEQEDNSPLDSGQWRKSPAEPRLATGRESRANPPQGGLAPAKRYTSARSTRFEQMDVDPPEDNDSQEPITTNNSRDARVEDEDESVNDSWRMRVEALCTSLDEAECFSCIQPTRRQEILTNFLQTAHLYRLLDGLQDEIRHLHMYIRGDNLRVCNEYNGFWDLTWLLSGGGSKDSQLFRQQCCKVIYTSKGPCR